MLYCIISYHIILYCLVLYINILDCIMLFDYIVLYLALDHSCRALGSIAGLLCLLAWADEDEPLPTSAEHLS